MLLFILWGIVATLAIGQGLLMLFLIRSRGHALSVAAAILKLQDAASTMTEFKTELSLIATRLTAVEQHLTADETTSTDDTGSGKIIRLAAVGGSNR